MSAIEEELPVPAAARRVVIAPPRAVGSRRHRPPAASRRPALVGESRSSELPTSEAVSAAALLNAGGVASPTFDITHVMKVFLIGLSLAVLFGAKGLVHAGKGMDLGSERTVVLALGEPLQGITGAVGLTLPWDLTARALGRSTDSGAAPLLSAPTRAPLRHPGLLLPPLRTPTAAHPLRLLVTGDSLTEYLAPQLVDEATRVGPVRGYADTHYGTGIVRPDFVDWSVVARQQVDSDHPDAVVVMMGGNDNQNMTMPNGDIIQAGSAQWTAEYARRVAICMRIWSQGGRARVYWLAMPPARSDQWSAVNRKINVAIRRAAAQVPRAEFVNVLGPVTDKGKYADFVGVGGQPTLVRTPDGIHFNSTGSDIVSHEVLRLIQTEWHLSAHGRQGRPLRQGKRAA